MTEKKLERLSTADVARLVSVRDEWLAVGLATGPTDREVARDAVSDAYKIAQLVPPKLFIWLSSPLAGCYGAALLSSIDQVRAQVGAQVGAQVRAQVRDQVGAQVRAQVRDHVRDQVGAQVGDQVRAQVWAKVGAQVGAQVWFQVRAQVRDQVGAQVGDQVGAQVGDQVWAQVRAQVGAQVGEQVRAQVGDHTWAQVGAQVGDQVWAQVGDQVWAQVRAQVGAQVGEQVRAQVGDHTWAQVGAQVGDQVWAQVGAQVRAQVRDHVRDQVGAQVGDQVGAQVWDQVGEQVRAQVGDHTWAQVGAQVGDQVWAQVGAQVWAQVRAQVGQAVYGSHDAGWLSFYSFFSKIPSIKGPQRLAPLAAMARIAGWWWPFEGACIVTDRPVALFRDQANRLHRSDGPAILYPDGWSFFAWHGFRLPVGKEWIIADKARLNPELIDTETNAELRRVMLEVFGFDRYLAARPYKVLAADELHGQPRRLIEVQGRAPLRIIEVVNGSLEPDGTRRKFHLGAMPGVTPHDVIAASYGFVPGKYREAIRT